MTSLMEVVELPTAPAKRTSGDQPPALLSDLTLLSVFKAAIETLPVILADSIPASALPKPLYAFGWATPLSNVTWLQKLEQQQGNILVLDRKGLTARGGLLPDDHLFKSMARNGLIRDNHVVWAPTYPTLAPDQRRPANCKNTAAPAAACNAPTTASTSAAALTGSTGTATSEAHPTAASPSSSSSSSFAAAATAAPSPSSSPTVFNVYSLRGAVCGHRGIVHGGLSSAIIDETFGYLLHLLAAAGAGAGAAEAEANGPAGLARPRQRQLQEGVWAALSDLGLDLRSAMTAHLEVDFVRPLPSESTVVCMTQIERVEGRKLWLCALLMSKPPFVSGSTTMDDSADACAVFAKGKALYVVPMPAGIQA